MKLAFIARVEKPEAVEYAARLMQEAKSRGHDLVLEPALARFLGQEQLAGDDEQLKSAGVIIVLGGDGTFLGATRRLRGTAGYFLAVDVGGFGFMSEAAPDDIEGIMGAVENPTAHQGFRSMLEATIIPRTGAQQRWVAINDVVVSKAVGEGLIEVALVSRGHPICNLRADGVVFASPSGSTAYSLSAGGPIVHPSLECMIVTPICPHTLATRPLVLPTEHEIEVTLGPQAEIGRKVMFVVDGQERQEIAVGDRLLVRGAEDRVKVCKLERGSFYQKLREKLRWGMR